MTILLDVLAVGAIDSSGEALEGGIAYVYQVGTTVPANIYQDRNLTIPASNPITLDSAGRAEVYANEEVRVVIEASDGTAIDDIASLGTVAAEEEAAPTTVTMPRNERLASSRKPDYHASSVGTVVTIQATTNSPAPVIINDILYVNTSDQTCDLSTSGRGGLDTGTVAVNTPYYLYAIPNTNESSWDAVASVTPPTTGPTGFGLWSYIGSCATAKSTAVFYQFVSVGGVLQGEYPVDSQGHDGDTDWNAETYSGLPITARRAYVEIYSSGTEVADDLFSVAGTDDHTYGALQARCNEAGIAAGAFGWTPIFEAQTIYLKTSNSAVEINAELYGWHENPMEYK